MGNVIVGQSGGPTSVINSSLVGVFRAAKERGAEKIYGMLHGVEGLLKEQYVDLCDHIHDELEIELLKRTPSSYLGSCRYKLPNVEENEEVYVKIFEILKKLNIEYFFYIGGNDSMDTIKKLSGYAKDKNIGIIFMGVPKTIDNDLAVTDHTPGFGSAAKCIGTVMKEVIRDGYVYGNNNVTIVEIMGRNAGWLTAASAMARMEDCPGPDLIYVPEVVFDIDRFVQKVAKIQKEKSAVIIAVSEGLKLNDGRYVCELNDHVVFTDSFGHKSLSGTARYLANKVAKEVGSKTRAIEFSTMQRCASHIVSRTDITEAFLAGGHAVKAGFEGHTAKMIIFNRTSNDPYHITTQPCDVDLIANVEKKLPLEWLCEDNTFVTKEFLTYCRPLIQAELTPVMVDGLPRHLYHGLL